MSDSSLPDRGTFSSRSATSLADRDARSLCATALSPHDLRQTAESGPFPQTSAARPYLEESLVISRASSLPQPRPSPPQRRPPAPQPHLVSHGGSTRTPPNLFARLWAFIERSPGATFSALAILYFAIVIPQAINRPLWVDEFITLDIARQGSLSGIWAALRLGADPNPPLSHLLLLLSTHAFGDSPLAIRLPSILAIFVAIAALWHILRRWLSPGYASLGVLTFMATRGFDYAYEARSYAALTAFTMAALLCWLRTTPPRTESLVPARSPVTKSALHPGVSILFMAAALAGAVSSNYYGVLAWFPIAAGEALLTLRGHRRRPAIWIALAAAALPLIAYLPLIRHNIAEFAPHAWNRPHPGMLLDSYLVLVEGVFWPVLAAALWLLWSRRSLLRSSSHKRTQRVSTLRQSRGPQPHELAALATLLLYPVLGLILACAGAGMVSDRCVLPVCCGFAIAAGLLAARLCRGPRTAVLLLGAALLWVVARETACAVILHRQRTAFAALTSNLRSTPAGQPILIFDFSLALPLAHAAPDLRSRLIYPIDFNAIHAAEPWDSGEQNLWAGRNGIFPLRIVPYTPALAATPALVLTQPGDWLTHKLTHDGATLTDITTPAEAHTLDRLGGVFSPLANEHTRLATLTTRH